MAVKSTASGSPVEHLLNGRLVPAGSAKPFGGIPLRISDANDYVKDT
jgi:hypothetical protein